MLRLDTQFEIQNVSYPKLFKVITPEEFVSHGTAGCAGAASFDDLMLWLDESSTANQEQWLSVPVGGFLLPSNSSELDHVSAALLKNPKDSLVVQPGDVIAVSPGSNVVRVLYRRGANSNLLFMTDRCNSLCLMCSQPPKDVDDRWHVDENLKLIDLVDRGAEQLGISGGEPTLYRDGLLAIIEHAKRVLPEKSVHILSNGRLLSDPSWISDLQRVNHPNLTWGVPLYADNAADHDNVVQAPGAFSETIAGLYNLQRAGQKIEIRMVLSKLTTPRLGEWAHFVFRNLPFVHHVALMGIENTGLAKKNYEQLWIDPADYQKELNQAAFFLDIRGIAVSIYNLPLCVLDPVLGRFYRQSISDWKNLFIDTCQTCSATDACAGFFKSHSTKWQSRSIHPLSVDDLIIMQGALCESA
ncbi:His-Xaa-Ser system radical SAM maturase HxsC [Pseudomonas azerbaijanoccidens]|uniref:His-Xaa-Ser system radical SAM maturase HxsC n=1 Tax=Pseudomonas azerbaijanoccidentalis TaxID=2842347 RepID=UPI002009DE13|nr:His-Xaa-Ser system radical SAM maturase HxsC [Pseudomonas azerbaijanoccidentalis]MCK8664869.1 His-Xaa-Ser system radical SAM maturase HxsC [Pseudomonas azerbaijanoccidentalis]